MQGWGERVLVAALDGWSDAAEASSTAIRLVRESGAYECVYAADPELYFDYQYARPTVSFDADGVRTLTWPQTQLWRPLAPQGDTEVWLLTGLEPARAWQALAAEIVDQANTWNLTGLLTLGSMMSDVPHTRALPIHRTSDDADLRATYSMDKSQYEGPAGFLTVLQLAFGAADIASGGLWVSVPHYGGGHSASPKATLSLLDALASVVPVTFDRDDLDKQAARWEAGLDAILQDEPELAAYVQELERAKDEWDSPEASGESLAREFERYLRRDGDGPQRP